MNIRKMKSARKGFTLAEAMMAMVILSMAASSVLVPYTAGASAQKEGVKRAIAAKLAADILEEIRIADFDTLAAGYSSTENAGTITDSAGQVYNDAVYQNLSRTLQCSLAPSIGPDLVIATATVSEDGVEIARVSMLVTR